LKTIEQFTEQLARSAKKKRGQAIFITGTDTGVGKTWVTGMLLKQLQECGIRAVGFKPICCGDRADALSYWKLVGRRVPLDVINPIHLKKPVAPVSQSCPSWIILIGHIRKALRELSCQFEVVLIEGAGGFLCPITSKHTMRELAIALRVPVMVVAHNRLGVLNHTLLTLEAVEQAKLRNLGVILNGWKNQKDLSSTSNMKVLKKLTKTLVLPVSAKRHRR
jgi:dethiobiotin synthetase